jgi:hypothetical protein
MIMLALFAGDAKLAAAEKETSVKGTVCVDGSVPPGEKIKVEDAMRRVTGEEYYVTERWLVGENNGLANCVVTLKAKDPAKRIIAKPLSKAILDKVGVRYVPRILVVTRETPVMRRNKESPCSGFDIKGSKPLLGNQTSYSLVPGSERQTVLRGPDICSVTCPVRAYARGYIHVVDTPYFAVTDRSGAFTIRGVPSGDYLVSVWHEEIGRLTKDTGPVELTVTDGADHTLRYRVTPAGNGKK